MATKALCREDLVAESIQDLRRVVKAIEDYSRKVEHRFGLTGPQAWTLWEMGIGGPQSLKELAARMAMDPSTLVGVIDRLLVKGLVLKSKDGEDRRQVSLRPSAKGWDLLAEAPHPSQGCLRQGLEQMETRDIQQLHRSMQLLVDVLETGPFRPSFVFGENK
ncbi:MAG: winged helix-turn-helix transcriptional regulator [Acidobacteria bacterium]|nr:winged helix-turn-helix transcriptional regulator [Acidobacteriota bacterium]